MIEKMTVKYDTAQLLKKIGFCEPTLFFYDGFIHEDKVYFIEYRYRNFNGKNERDEVCSAPLQAEVLDWLRTKHAIHIDIRHIRDGERMLYSWSSSNYHRALAYCCNVHRYSDWQECCENAIRDAIKRWLLKTDNSNK